MAATKRASGVTEAVRTVARLSRLAEQVCQQTELSLPQYRLLLFLATEPQRFGRLASQAALRPPTLTALVDGLEKRGMVERLAVPGDRRALDVRLTETGCAAMADTEAALTQAFDHLIEGIGSRHDGAALLAGLAELGTVMDHELDKYLDASEKGS